MSELEGPFESTFPSMREIYQHLFVSWEIQK